MANPQSWILISNFLFLYRFHFVCWWNSSTASFRVSLCSLCCFVYCRQTNLVSFYTIFDRIMCFFFCTFGTVASCSCSMLYYFLVSILVNKFHTRSPQRQALVITSFGTSRTFMSPWSRFFLSSTLFLSKNRMVDPEIVCYGMIHAFGYCTAGERKEEIQEMKT